MVNTTPDAHHAAPGIDLDAMQWLADPLADATVAQMLGPWVDHAAGNDANATIAANGPRWIRLRIANRLIAQWTTNASLADWIAHENGGNPEHFTPVAAALERYVREARKLPAWADADKIDRGEAVFMEHGLLSCLLLFCASLPECYVLPDLSDVLHAAGQLEKHTEHRIRATAAMIFPIMMRGGLTSPEGSGVAQVLKVRLIHAMIRNLILRGDPESAALATQHVDGVSGIVAALDLPVGEGNMFETLFAHGWDLRRDALPCNQEELAYTLLTFHYVFLRGMRNLGVGLRDEDERAYLHTWNVMSHVLGVRPELTTSTMSSADTLFQTMQARGRADADKRVGALDPRPKLGQALMKSMEDAIPLSIVKGFPSLLTTRLCGKTVAGEIGVLGRAGVLCRVLFAITMMLIRGIDTVVRSFVPQFSISRMLARVLGYHLMSKLLMDQTRPLKLPDHLLNDVQTMFGQWSDDANQVGWLNRLEDRLTAPGRWGEVRS